MTGVEFYTILQQKIDKAYSAYIDTTKADRLIRETIYRLVEKLYSGLITQKETDELWSMIVKEQSFATAGALAISSVTGYAHLFSMKFIFEDNITGFTFSNGVFTLANHNLRKKDVIKYSGTLYPITKVTKDTFTAAIPYTSGTISLYREFFASPWFSDRKKDIYHTPTKESPRYELVGTPARQFNLYPQPTSVKVDYMKTPTDISSTSATAITAYTDKFLYRLLDECVMNYAEQVRDFELKQNVAQSIAINP
jgi:hypothetical protein